MDELIALLKEKNDHLEEFYHLNDVEMDNFSRLKFDRLELFYQTRDKVLELIKEIDSKVERINQSILAVPGPEQKRQYQGLMATRDRLVKEILAQDLQILGYIERAKSNLIRDLQALKFGRKAVAAYKAPDVISRLTDR